MTADRAQKFLQREVGDPKLRVRWRDDIEKFEVGRQLEDGITWFYVVSDGDGGYKPVDMRTVRKVISLDTWRRDKALTMDGFIKQIEERKLAEDVAKREILKYKVKHESRYISRAAHKDGIL
jgi:hypothetical protein